MNPTLPKRFLFARFLKALLIIVISTGLASPSPALALRPASIEGAGLEELKQALAPRSSPILADHASQDFSAGLEEPRDTVSDLLATLDQREHPQLRYQPLKPNQPSASEYESHGPIVFAWRAEGQLQHVWIRRKRSTGQFTIAPIVPALNNPALHPHLLVFQNMLGGQEIPLPVGEPVRLGNREIRITQVAKDRHVASLTDLGSQHGMYLLMDIAGNGSQGIAHQINREDWIAAERILYVLGTSITNRDKAGYDRQSYANKLVEIIQGWTTLEPTMQRRLLSHLLVSRGWTAEGNPRQSAEWLRRFFRIFQHVFYMSPEAAISKGRQGVILLGTIREYTPVNWRGFRSVTHVAPIMTNMKGGFKAGTNDDEVIVLDDQEFDAEISAIHEAQHAFDQLEYTQYGMRSIGVRVGRDADQTTQTALALTTIQGWELEFTAYARTMVEVGRRIEADPQASAHHVSDLIDNVFGAKYLQHYLAYENNPEEHARGTREFLNRFIFEALKRAGYRSRDWNFTTTPLEDMGLMVPDVLMQHLNIVKNTVSGTVIRESAQRVLNEFYIAKLGYVPNYPDITTLTPVTVSPPTERSTTVSQESDDAMPGPLPVGQMIRLVPPKTSGSQSRTFRFTGPVAIEVDGVQYRLRVSSQPGVLTLENYSTRSANRLPMAQAHPLGSGAELSYQTRAEGYAVTIKNISAVGGVSIRQESGLEEPTIPVSTWDASQFPVPMSQGVVLQPAEGRVAEKVGYIFRPAEAGLATLFASFQNPDTDPAIYYVLVDHVDQAQALIQAGVAPVRIVALAEADDEALRFSEVGVPGDNVLIGQTLEEAIEEIRGWIRIVHGTAVRVPGTTSWSTEIQLLLAQLNQWLDEERWVASQGLTAEIATTVAHINSLA